MVGFSRVERCSAASETAWIPLELVKNIRTEPGEFVAPPRSRKKWHRASLDRHANAIVGTQNAPTRQTD
jgi:hypothetical protein